MRELHLRVFWAHFHGFSDVLVRVLHTVLLDARGGQLVHQNLCIGVQSCGLKWHIGMPDCGQLGNFFSRGGHCEMA